ncbi:short-chain dehydrogenase [Coprinopsis cinerea okayama7|uniref:Short-chain dehydrogenase n=1 Tax=Coprinopsis cinerea (strain Okayama-7 / 130 / ATCC MYA-4618 / FGSC 9003) TaxID=240176 RepID=A8NXQ1_COPC7|nr:short-chain dehydrogenase [Coprinopsis cinerea okayama7\|eukprot:XP_001837233.2 short-chain dehydrogenase [Coprinopsis cinerea okayama7\
MHKPVVVVTGASKGIGLAVTRHLINEFNAVVVAISRSRSPELAEIELATESVDFIECDIVDEKKLTDAINHAAHRHRRLDGLILNAGTIDPMTRIGDDATPLDHWKCHFDINFFSLITATRSALPSLRKNPDGGRIVFVSSGAAVKGTAGWGPYNASKAAMNSLCRTLAEEESDVISVALRPGMVDTNMQAKLRLIGTNAMSPEDYEKFIKVHAEGKLVKPEDCGYVIAALALQAPKELSGKFVSWDSDECAPFRKPANANANGS